MTIKVKLKDPSSIFHDASQGVTIEGDKTFSVTLTELIRSALSGGALVRVDEEETPAPENQEISDDQKNLDKLNEESKEVSKEETKEESPEPEKGAEEEVPASETPASETPASETPASETPNSKPAGNKQGNKK